MKEIIDFRKIRKVPFTEVAAACAKVRRVMNGEVHESHICSDLEKELWSNRDYLDNYIKEEFNFIIPQKEIQIPEFLNRKVIPQSGDTQKNSEYVHEETSEEKEHTDTDELIDKLENAIKLIKLYGKPTRSKIYIDFSFDDNCVKHRVTIHHNTKQ